MKQGDLWRRLTGGFRDATLTTTYISGTGISRRPISQAEVDGVERDLRAAAVIEGEPWRVITDRVRNYAEEHDEMVIIVDSALFSALTDFPLGDLTLEDISRLRACAVETKRIMQGIEQEGMVDGGSTRAPGGS